MNNCVILHFLLVLLVKEIIKRNIVSKEIEVAREKSSRKELGDAFAQQWDRMK